MAAIIKITSDAIGADALLAANKIRVIKPAAAAIQWRATAGLGVVFPCSNGTAIVNPKTAAAANIKIITVSIFPPNEV
ncbi:MAG: hypothetical protein ACM339_01675 [Ignavibacteria bacterium]